MPDRAGPPGVAGVLTDNPPRSPAPIKAPCVPEKDQPETDQAGIVWRRIRTPTAAFGAATFDPPSSDHFDDLV